MKLELNEERFLELLTEMWSGDCGNAGPSQRIIIEEDGEMSIRTEPGSLHSWSVPGAVTLASRDSATDEQDLSEADQEWTYDQIDDARRAVDYHNINAGEVESCQEK